MTNGNSDDGDLVRFIFDLGNGDVLGLVTRAQIHIEHELKRFIDDRAPSPKYVNHGNMDFDQSVRLATILGLKGELKQALTVLRTTRDKFGRMLDMKFGKQEANNFYNSLPQDIKSVIREIYSEFKLEQNLIEFKRQSPQVQLIWFLIAIWTVISTDRKLGKEPPLSAVKLPSRYIEELEERKFAFLSLMEGKSDFEMVIQAHTHIECELLQFAFAAAPQPNEIKPKEYDFAGKLRLALILGLDSTLEKPLAALSALRNKFAHQLGMQLTHEEARKIYAALDSRAQAEAVQAWTTTCDRNPGSGRPRDFKDAKPQDLVALSAVMLYLTLAVEHLTLRSASVGRSGS